MLICSVTLTSYRNVTWYIAAAKARVLLAIDNGWPALLSSQSCIRAGLAPVRALANGARRPGSARNAATWIKFIYLMEFKQRTQFAEFISITNHPGAAMDPEAKKSGCEAKKQFL